MPPTSAAVSVGGTAADKAPVSREIKTRARHARRRRKEERKPKFTVVGGSGDPPQAFIRALARLLLDVADKQIAEERQAAEAADQAGKPNSCYNQAMNPTIVPSSKADPRLPIATEAHPLSEAERQRREPDRTDPLIEQHTADIRRFGKLAVYDTACRLGVYLGLKPEVVYLHAGTAKGAKALGLDTSRGYLEMAELPKPFRLLEPWECEDFLCIYKARLKRKW